MVLNRKAARLGLRVKRCGPNILCRKKEEEKEDEDEDEDEECGSSFEWIWP